MRHRPDLSFEIRLASARFALLSSAEPPRLIISAGRRTHLWSVVCKLRYSAKNIVLMRPSLPLSWFNLALIPEHDRPDTTSLRIELTRGAINRMVPGIKEPGSNLILIGGPSKHIVWSDKSVLQQIQEIRHSNSNLKLRVATSRRTPGEFVNQLDEISGVEVITPESVSSSWLPETLSATERVWVTKDSVSMVFEALSAGCSVSLIGLESRQNSRTQHGMQMLIDTGLVDHRLEFSAPANGSVLAEADRCASLILEKKWL